MNYKLQSYLMNLKYLNIANCQNLYHETHLLLSHQYYCTTTKIRKLRCKRDSKDICKKIYMYICLLSN